MIDNEAIHRLKQLPKDAPLTTEHIIAIINWVEKSATQSNETGKPQPLIDEKQLSDWLGEAVSTIQKWRLSGKGPKFIKKPKNVAYRVKDVEDWLERHTVTSTSEATVKGISLSTLFPVFFHTIDEEYKELSLLQSIESEQAPDGFELIEVRAMKNVWGDPNPFNHFVVPFVVEMKFELQNRPMIDFYRSLAKDNKKAKKLLKGVNVRTLNIAYWFYAYCLNNPLDYNVLDALRLLLKHGADINSRFTVKDVDYSLGHLLADSHGHLFFVDFTKGEQVYKEIVSLLLDENLDVQAKNKDGLTPMDVVEALENDGKPSLFKSAYASWKLNNKLNQSLPGKPPSSDKGFK